MTECVVFIVAIGNLLGGLLCGFFLGTLHAWHQEDKE